MAARSDTADYITQDETGQTPVKVFEKAVTLKVSSSPGPIGWCRQDDTRH